MQHVDALSHAFPEENHRDLSILKLNNAADEIVLYRFADEATQNKIKILRREEEDRSPFESSELQHFELDQGILYKIVGKQRKLFIPKSMRKSLVVLFHDFGGHFGVNRTLRKMQEFYFFPGT
ncbi:hypothetical protein TKK_0010881 [Trichogramma kaykai]